MQPSGSSGKESDNPLSSHDNELIVAYIKANKAHLPRINGASKLCFQLPDKNVKVFGCVNIPFSDFVRRCSRNFYETKLLKLAAWDWFTPDCKLDKLKVMQKCYFLDHLGEVDFLSGLRGQVDKIKVDHPDLRNWVLRCVALLDYRIENHSHSRTTEYNDLLTGFDLQLRRLYYVAPALILPRLSGQQTSSTEPQKQRERVEGQLVRLLDGTLRAAGQVVLSAFGKKIETDKNSAPSVNIMFPVNVDEEHPSVWSAKMEKNRLKEIKRNDHNSTVLFERSASQCNELLLLSFQSQSDVTIENHDQNEIYTMTLRSGKTKTLYNNYNKKIGFWVPRNLDMRGASKAFDNKSGSLVIRDDLPEDEEDSNIDVETWKFYISKNIQEPAFISLPCLVQSEKPNNKLPIAILNVDFTPNENDIIYRGYHDEWLEDARDRVKDFTYLAFHIYTLLSAINPEKYSINIRSRIKELDD